MAYSRFKNIRDIYHSMGEKNTKTHAGRSDLAGEHKLSDIGQLISLVSFLLVWVLDSFIFHFSDFLSTYIQWWILILIATPFWIIAGILSYMGMKTVFGTPQETPKVISEGVFKFTRHPIYLGSMLVYVGLIITTLSLISLGLFLLIMLFYNCVANYEEKLLLNKFSEKYIQYQQQVPKWGIRIIRKKIKNIDNPSK
jgi:protein-S-isoprenylcysteine O-methyltransferase Ste14